MTSGTQQVFVQDTGALQTCQELAEAVRHDIQQVLANSWELQQLNHTAPKVGQATLNQLALPRKARVQQQVIHNLHDVSDFANWKAAQLARQRAAKAAREAKLAITWSAQKEALQDWHRQQEQLGGQLLRIHQQQAQQHQQQAKIATAAATQRAKQDLQLMKEEQERKKLHAAELRAQLGKHRMVT